MTTKAIDDYITNTVKKGDKESALIAALVAPTLKNCKYVDILQEGMNGISVLKNLPEDYDVVVYSIGGDTRIKDLKKYTISMVERLANISNDYGFTPLAFADVIDASDGDNKDVELIGNTLREVSDHFGYSVLNGELAILRNRVIGKANINGTMIALVPKENNLPGSQFTPYTKYGIVSMATFDHKGKAVWINSDGQGTKGEFQERLKQYELGLRDSVAMKADDTIKLGADLKVISDIIQIKGKISMDIMEEAAKVISKELGITYIIQKEYSGDKIYGYSDESAAFNISGSAVSLIDEEFLRNPPMPHVNDFLVAISGYPNPRSNGITDKRKLMIKLFGENYQDTKIGKIFLEYLAAPSIILYPHFRELINSGLATSVYHMSGGAYDSKLAKPLAKHGLYTEIGEYPFEQLFNPDWRELTLAGANFTSARTAYGKWPMGNDGYVTTQDPSAVIFYLNNHGLEGRVVGQLQQYPKKTGVKLNAYNGTKVYFSGIERKS